MASQYYGVERGAQSTAVTTGSSTTSKKIELVVDLTSGATRQEVLDSLDKIRDFIFNERSTPFAQ